MVGKEGLCFVDFLNRICTLNLYTQTKMVFVYQYPASLADVGKLMKNE
jgi:hypothetical protein